jgi:esterase
MPLQLAFEALGDGPPVVVLHGLFGSSRDWRGVARALSAQHRVLCVDLRNHGRLPWTDSIGHAGMAADVRALIDSEGLVRPIVIGHSMGGKTAMTLALDSPESAGRLIVGDIAPVSYADRLTPYVEAMQSINPRTTADRAEARRQLSAKIPDAAAVGFMLHNLTVRDDHFDWRLNLPAIGAAVPALCAFPPTPTSRRFDGPALLIAGSMSDHVSPSERAAFAKLFAQPQFTQVEGAGRWVHADRTAEFLNALGLLHQAMA